MAPGATHLAALLEQSAAQHPGSVAVEDVAGHRLSHEQLQAASHRLAQRLASLGVRPGDRVGTCMPKSLESVASIMAVLRAGAAYVPVDAFSPPERNLRILKGCGARVVLADPARAGALSAGGLGAALLVVPPGAAEDAFVAWLPNEAPQRPATPAPSPDDLAYILYTSGSTGIPKGVAHTHASALSFIEWSAHTFRPSADERFGSHAPLHFDLSILDLYVPMSAGAAVVLASEDLGKDPQGLAAWIASRRLTSWYSVPSILALMAEHGRLESHDFSALRRVLFAGEVFPVRHLRMLKEKWPHPEYWNLYGPTETNVCTAFRIPDVVEPLRDAPYPIGRPCSNVEAAITGDDLQPVTDGAEGILHVAASGPVMQGYWGAEDLTREAFRTDASGKRWYCTGDVVRADAAGDWIFAGRRDRMVKKRGHRVELGEIEACLHAHARLREAATVAMQGPDGVQITAFLSTHDGGRVSIIELKEFCSRRVPAYMIPDRFTFLDALPRSSTGKTDYQALLRLLVTG